MLNLQIVDVMNALTPAAKQCLREIALAHNPPHLVEAELLGAVTLALTLGGVEQPGIRAEEVTEHLLDFDVLDAVSAEHWIAGACRLGPDFD